MSVPAAKPTRTKLHSFFLFILSLNRFSLRSRYLQYIFMCTVFRFSLFWASFPPPPSHLFCIYFCSHLYCFTFIPHFSSSSVGLNKENLYNELRWCLKDTCKHNDTNCNWILYPAGQQNWLLSICWDKTETRTIGTRTIETVLFVIEK